MARPALANAERFPGMEIVAAWPQEGLATLRFGPSSAIAILAHDDKFDHPALVAALRSAAGYVGAIGSRTTNEKRVAWLRWQGVTERDIARIHAPIGLDIGATSVEEIALAILAEIVAVRRHRGGRSLSAEPVVAAR